MLKQRKNKKFSYKPRFGQQNDAKGELHKPTEEGRLSSKWQRERNVNLGKGRRGFSLKTLLLILVLLLICMYILENKFM